MAGRLKSEAFIMVKVIFKSELSKALEEELIIAGHQCKRNTTCVASRHCSHLFTGPPTSHSL